jgi:hypothetical protein
MSAPREPGRLRILAYGIEMKGLPLPQRNIVSGQYTRGRLFLFPGSRASQLARQDREGAEGKQFDTRTVGCRIREFEELSVAVLSCVKLRNFRDTQTLRKNGVQL